MRFLFHQCLQQADNRNFISFESNRLNSLTILVFVRKNAVAFYESIFASCSSVPQEIRFITLRQSIVISCDNKSYRVNRMSNNSIHVHVIYNNHRDNVLASCLRKMLRLVRMIEEKYQKGLERQECVTDGQMFPFEQPGISIESISSKFCITCLSSIMAHGNNYKFWTKIKSSSQRISFTQLHGRRLFV